ncbi:bacillithiol transferase BstA [Rhodocytophaga rosea]|uniref:Bacillithiol transferase BstA n=1 Tax=Rhodocytophaga rosea TaxID=2704465 RepID=A0A6C0GBT9_9BACT|nr:bacillithiol transferase BstA [Rhodocytophaga rosea]QHT65415.1 bacillithiol transferase BstA [Rhodocytophaga rosea]
MQPTENNNLSYPIRKYQAPNVITPEHIQSYIADIALAPLHLKKVVAGLSPAQLDTPYRPGGWTVRQVVHHVPDSHINAYVRFKFTLTEEEPTIKPYNEKLWAETYDVQVTPIETSLTLLEALHHRWVLLLQSLSAKEIKRNYRHPELGIVSLEWAIGSYAWHGKHHVAHITSLRKRMGWM